MHTSSAEERQDSSAYQGEHDPTRGVMSGTLLGALLWGSLFAVGFWLAA